FSFNCRRRLVVELSALTLLPVRSGYVYIGPSIINQRERNASPNAAEHKLGAQLWRIRRSMVSCQQLNRDRIPPKGACMDIEGTIQFIVSQQAQFAADITTLKTRMDDLQAGLDHLRETVSQL